MFGKHAAGTPSMRTATPMPNLAGAARAALLGLAALVFAAGFVQTDGQVVAVPGGSGAWLPPGPALSGDDPLRLADPAGTVVIVYNHGSDDEATPDPCAPLAPQAQAGTTPQAVKGLAGATVAGRRVAVFAFCTRTKTSAYPASGPPKISGRIQDIRALTQDLRAKGLPPENLFLMGHSAGGFASLMLESWDPELQNAAMAVAPAFAGPRAGRDTQWTILRQTWFGEMTSNRVWQALVVAIEGDAYNRPRDIEFLQQVDGVEFVALSYDPCFGGLAPHDAIFAPCFEEMEPAFHGFMATRLGAAPQGRAPGAPPQAVPAAQQPAPAGRSPWTGPLQVQ
jgi:hypothetical protein